MQHAGERPGESLQALDGKKRIAVPTGLTVNWRLSDKQAIIVNQYPGSTEKRVAGAL